MGWGEGRGVLRTSGAGEGASTPPRGGRRTSIGTGRQRRVPPKPINCDGSPGAHGCDPEAILREPGTRLLTPQLTGRRAQASPGGSVCAFRGQARPCPSGPRTQPLFHCGHGGTSSTSANR